MQSFKVLIAALFALVSVASAAMKVEEPVRTVPLNFVPHADKPWSATDNNKLRFSGTCTLDNEGRSPCSFLVKKLTARGQSSTRGKSGGKLRRSLGDRNLAEICDLVNIVVGATSINIAGLDVDIPQDIIIDITGQTGLIGELLCGLLAGGGILSDILEGLQGVSLEGITAALQDLVLALNGAV